MGVVVADMDRATLQRLMAILDNPEHRPLCEHDQREWVICTQCESVDCRVCSWTRGVCQCENDE